MEKETEINKYYNCAVTIKSQDIQNIIMNYQAVNKIMRSDFPEKLLKAIRLLGPEIKSLNDSLNNLPEVHEVWTEAGDVLDSLIGAGGGQDVLETMVEGLRNDKSEIQTSVYPAFREAVSELQRIIDNAGSLKDKLQSVLTRGESNETALNKI